MAFSTERVLLAWVEDLEQGLEDLGRIHQRQRHDELLKDLLPSAQGLLALARSELRQLLGTDVPLLDNDMGDIRTADNVRRLCSRLRRVFRTDESGRESTD